MKLSGKTVLVTGASRGIGAAIARCFATEGARLVLVARSSEVEALAASLRAGGHEVEALQGDLTDETHVRAAIQLCRSKFGGLHGLVNNAGLLTPGLIGMMRLEDVRRMFEINVIAAIGLSQLAARCFPRGEGGAIVNIASIAGRSGMVGMSAYSASKAAMIGFTHAAAKELGPQKIRVNAIAPGFIDTEMAQQGGAESFQKRMASIPFGRIGRPEEVAGAALFLVAETGAYITGQVLGVDGAMTV